MKKGGLSFDRPLFYVMEILDGYLPEMNYNGVI